MKEAQNEKISWAFIWASLYTGPFLNGSNIVMGWPTYLSRWPIKFSTWPSNSCNMADGLSS